MSEIGVFCEMTDRLIYHVFADYGIEAETLECYGRVVCIGLDARDTNESQPIKADARQLPLDRRADLAFMHPPCTRWSDMPNANKDGDAPNFIPLARRIGREYADHYVIENKPRAPLRDPTFLDGRMFGLPIHYERAFETSFPLEQPPRQTSLTDVESSGFFYSEKSHDWWAAVKGIHPHRYPKEAVGKNCLPAPYVHYICRKWLDELGDSDGFADYSHYGDSVNTQRRRRENSKLLAFAEGDVKGGER